MDITKSLFALCDSIIAAKKNATKLRTEGDFVKFSHQVAEAELRDSEAELKEALRQVYRNDKENFSDIVRQCDEYIEKTIVETEEIEISYFRNALDTTPTAVFLSQFLFSIKHRESIEQLRKLATKEEKDVKKKSMPCATISGTFTQRSIAGIKKYNGLACMDFDAKDNNKTAEEIKEMLSRFSEVYYAGLSIGGAGVYAIIKTDNRAVEYHSKVIETIGETLKNANLFYDKSGKDVSRLRFISYDPQPYFNGNADVFKTALHVAPKPKMQVVKTERTADANTTRKQVELLLDKIDSQFLDMTTDYQDWLTLGFAIANEFGHDGEDYFLRVSQHHPKFDPTDASRKYKNLVKENRSVTIKSFFKICKDNNLTWHQ